MLMAAMSMGEPRMDGPAGTPRLEAIIDFFFITLGGSGAAYPAE